MKNVIILVSFIGVIYITSVITIQCYQCNERIKDKDICQNASKVDCGNIFPQQAAVCMKTVQRFSSGASSWVFAQCQLRSAFTAEQIDACQVTKVAQANNQSDELETCTCTADFCNPAITLRNQNTFLVSGLIIAMVLPLL